MGPTSLGRRPGQWQIWLMAARVPTLPAAVVPVVVGTAVAMAQGSLRPMVLVAALLASLLIQIGTNLANDYFDFVHGADTTTRLGPVRVTQSGLLAPATVRLATILTFSAAAVIGLYLVLVGGWPILIVGLAAIAAGVLYTGGPWPLGYHGLGDLFAFVFFGPIAVLGTAYLHGAALTNRLWLAALPIGCLVTAILVVNNLRDIDTDRAAGKRTLAVYLGRTGTRIEYVLLLAVTYLAPVVQWLLNLGSIWLWLPWLTLPLAISLGRCVTGTVGSALNPALKGTARLELIFGLLLAVGLLL